jgi:signal transduction histidine kinase
LRKLDAQFALFVAPPMELDDETLNRLRHDIRSPLVVISGFAQLLAGDRVVSDEDRREYASRIETAAKELQQIVEDAIG